ncbi:MAG: ROK family transcriptional regulator [Sphaerochaeta sp.]|jgi:predicted NBD/HSP70 family sugar kinase|nr:ROK family transcriptional regulator [Sphaerochaeta sp.]
MTGNPLRASDLRIHNQNMVLSIIHSSKTGGISQSEVVNRTGLKAPTIFRIFTALEEEGLIYPLETNGDDQISKKGRRPVLYAVVKDARYTIGLEFWAAFLSLGVFDFHNERIYSVMHPLTDGVKADDIISLITQEVNRAIDRLDLDREKIIGVGVAAPGQVDLLNKRVRHYPRIDGMKDIALVDELETRLGLMVMIHNNCSALAFSEYRYGGYDHQGSMFTFLLRTGVNGAFVNNDQIYVNSQQQTIESGHIPINNDGPKCSCGSRGCLQAYLQDLDPNSIEQRLALFEGLEERLEERDGSAIRIIERAAGYLAIAMQIISRLLAPKSFLIVACCEQIAVALKAEVEHLLGEPDAFCSEPPKIFATSYDPLVAQRGAADLVLQEYFR